MSQGLINRKGFPRWVLLVSSSFVPSPLLLRWPKMPNRVEKQKRSSTLQRHNLLALFEECCFDAMPCSRCTEKGLRCRWVDEEKSKTRRCFECVRSGRKCDGTGRALSSGAVLLVAPATRTPTDEHQRSGTKTKSDSKNVRRSRRKMSGWRCNRI